VQSKKEESLAKDTKTQMKELHTEMNDEDITAKYDAQDDDDVIF